MPGLTRSQPKQPVHRARESPHLQLPSSSTTPSSTSSATRWILLPGRIARASRRPCARSIAPQMRPPARPPLTPSHKHRGGIKYPAIAQSWRRNWELVIPFFAFPEGVRRIIYTTDEIEVFSATPLRTGVENPKNRFKHAPCRDRLSSRTAIGNVLLRKMLPDPIPLLVSQPNHPTFIADRHPFVILR